MPRSEPPWYRRHTRLAGVVGLLAVVLIAAGFAATLRPHRHGSQTGIAADAPPASDEVAAAMSVLQLHAKALLAKDGQRWNAGIDQSVPAVSYAAHQRAVFTNLEQVPLSTWRYSLDAPVDSPDVLAEAAARLHGRVVVLHVSLAYALRGVDPAPTSKDQWLTLVNRSRSWLLASDSDAASTGGVSWLGPWDFGPLVVREAPHTLVLAHPAHAVDLPGFSALVERAISVVTSVWGAGWNRDVAVLIPDTDAEFAEVSADHGDTGDLAAVSVADQVLADGTVLGARIVLNPSNLSRLDANGRRLVIQHELTHIATRAVTNDQMPTWVIEGFADYVGNLSSTLPMRQSAAELAAEVRRGIVPTALPADTDFVGNAPRLAQTYEESWLACRLIASRAGQAALVRFYRTVSQGANTDRPRAVNAALRSVLGMDTAQFVRLWQHALRMQLS